MTGQVVWSPPLDHDCNPPTRMPHGYGIYQVTGVLKATESEGSIWRCDECGAFWQVWERFADPWQRMEKWRVEEARENGKIPAGLAWGTPREVKT